MGTNSIVNLKEPQSSDSLYAATVNFVHKTVNESQTVMDNIIEEKIEAAEVRSIRAVYKENVFQKVMTDDLFKEDDDDLHKVGLIDKDFHEVRQTYLFRIDYDSQIGYYSTRASVDLVYLPIGYYTMV